MPALPPRSTLLNASVVPVATIGSNIFSYALLLVAARVLSSASYGELSALLGVLLVAAVPMLAMQTVTARRIAVSGNTAGLASATALAAGATAAVILVLSPAIQRFLHLGSVVGVVLIAASVPATTTLGALMGRAQGQHNLGRLAALTAATNVGRSLGGLIGLIIGRTTISTLVGVCIGLSVMALLCGFPHRRALPAALAHRPDHASWSVVREGLHAGHAHAAFLIVTSLDVLLARHLLSADDAGRYAVGSVVTRAALWLPQSVGLMLFASMSIPHLHRTAVRRAFLAVVAVGAVTVIGCAVAGQLVVTLIGGAKYEEHLQSIVWIFALLGVCLALIQLSVLAGLSQRRPHRVLLLWFTGVADVVATFAFRSAATPLHIVTILTIVAGAAAVVGIALARQASTTSHRTDDEFGFAAGSV